MAGRQRSGGNGRRRRDLGQNFLVDDRLISRFVAGLDLVPGELVVDIGAGAGALTIPLARAGAEVWAVEIDPAWASRLAGAAERAGVAAVRADVGGARASAGRPTRGPERADLILQQEVARRHAASPPATLRTAAWAPWWRFGLGPRVGRDAFRPAWSRTGGGPETVARSAPVARPPAHGRQHPVGDGIGDSGHEPDDGVHDDPL